MNLKEAIERIEALEKKLKELEARPPIQYHYHTHPMQYPVFVPQPYPVPYYPPQYPYWYWQGQTFCGSGTNLGAASTYTLAGAAAGCNNAITITQ